MIAVHRGFHIGLGVIVASISAPTDADQRLNVPDGSNDQVVRRTDPGGDGKLALQAHALPDLVNYSIGTWQPLDPEQNPYVGGWMPNGEYLRLDIVLAGVINPPGPVACCGDDAFEPYRYGPNPIQGFIELDIDDDPDTGGESDFPGLRYLGNASRFGGLIPAPMLERVAQEGFAFDGDFVTEPWVERSGEDFHLAIVNWEIDHASIERSDTSDWLFGSGETWLVPGHLFQRAHGYRPYCSGCCRAGVGTGAYDPRVSLRFSHSVTSNRTTITLVYPLTQEASAIMRGDPSTEPMDVMYTNQNSIQEALTELHYSALFATPGDRQEPEFVMLAAWEFKNPDAYLDPAQWRLTFLLGGSYAEPQPDSPFVWSDIHPDAPPGDLNGDGIMTPADIQLFDSLVSERDGNPAWDADHVVNGSVELLGFAEEFSLLDVTYDGVVDDMDREQLVGYPTLPRCDFDHDLDVDQTDFAHIQRCLTGPGLGPPAAGCRNSDLDRDFDVDSEDIDRFDLCASGPAIPADIHCGRP